MLDTRPLLLESDFPAISRDHLTTLQVNLGYLCNLSCTHCHVAAGPTRRELMSRAVVELVLEFLQKHRLKTLDLTGGAPEMNPEFRFLVTEARKLGVTVIDRCNLTILVEPGYEDLAEFLLTHEIEVVASLPCYQESNVDKQRGKGVFERSIEALRLLNALGYGRGEGKLSLVYNPSGPNLPPAQEALQAAYKKELKAKHDIDFDYLLTITNMPISRFGSVLMSKKQFQPYMRLLKSSYSETNLPEVMCRSLLSVDWQGYVFDCDFNQMLDMPAVPASSDSYNHQGLARIASDRTHLSDLMEETFKGRPIIVADHCYGCTAGQGSSCSGAL